MVLTRAKVYNHLPTDPPGASTPVDVVTTEGLKEAMEGLRDGVKSLITKSERSLLLEVGKSIEQCAEARAEAALGVLHKDLSALVDRAEASVQARFESCYKQHHEQVEARLNRIEKGWEEAVERLGKVAEGLASAQSVHAGSLERLEQVFKSLSIPAPVVNVAAADVKFMPQINVPEQQAPVVHVAAPNVSVSPEFKSIVNVPEGPAPVFNVPEVKASPVSIEFPKRKVTKHITYDGQGRPVTVEEEG